jgi:hypothetical protein
MKSELPDLGTIERPSSRQKRMFPFLLGDVNCGQGCSAVDDASRLQAGRLMSAGAPLRAGRHAVLIPAVGIGVAVAGRADAADPSVLLARRRAFGRDEMATTDRREVLHALKGSRRPPLQHGRHMAGLEARCAGALGQSCQRQLRMLCDVRRESNRACCRGLRSAGKVPMAF